MVSGPDDEGKIIVYSSGIGSVREEEELNKCIKDIAGDDRTALFRIDVIEIPINEPSKSKIVNSPAVFADPVVFSSRAVEPSAKLSAPVVFAPRAS